VGLKMGVYFFGVACAILTHNDAFISMLVPRLLMVHITVVGSR